MLTMKQGTRIPLRSTRAKPQVKRIYVAEKTTVPANSSGLVKVRLATGSESNFGVPSVVEPLRSGLKTRAEKVTVVPSLVTLRQGEAYLEVINTSSQEARVPAAALVGMAKPLLASELNYLKDQPEKEQLCQNKNTQFCENIRQVQDKSEDWISEINIGTELTQEQRQKVIEVVKEHSAAFSQHELDLGRTHLVTHEIILKDNNPVQIPARKIPPHWIKEVDEQLDLMLARGIIRPSYSQYSTPLVIVPKKDGSLRLVNDYRALNNKSEYFPYPITNINETFSCLHGASQFSTLDLFSGYYQIALREEDKCKTSFPTLHRGSFEYEVLPMGLQGAPGTFQRCMNLVLKDIAQKFAIAYLDDVIVYSTDFESHLEHLKEVLKRLIQANMKLKAKKCHLFKSELQYLGHVIGKSGIKRDASKLETIRNWPKPKSVTELRSFLGLCNYYRKFVRDFAEVAAPLCELTNKNIKCIQDNWTRIHDECFELLKERMCSEEVLAYPEFNTDPQVYFVLDTDASDVRIGAVLNQVQSDGVERPIAYYSRKMRQSESRYPITRKELLAIVDSLKYFRFYLVGKRFKVRTDHNALTWLLRQTEQTGILGRWIERLSEFDFEIEHRSGPKHVNADALSRIPDPQQDESSPFARSLSCRATVNTDPASAVTVSSGNSAQAETCSLHSGVTSCCSPQNMAPNRHNTPSFSSRLLSKRQEQEPKERHPLVCNALLSDYLRSPVRRENLVAAQLADPALSYVRNLIESDLPKPNFQERLELSHEIRNLLGYYELFRIEDGVLRIDLNSGRTESKVVLPKSLDGEVFHEFHDSPLAGHLGRDKTYQRVKERFWRVGLATAVEKYVAKCKSCLESKSRKRCKAPVQNFPIVEPFSRLHIDLIGPISQTSKSGNKYVLSVIDSTSKFPFAFAIKNQKAKTVIKILQERVFADFGIPQWIHTDQGTQFTGKAFRKFLDLYGIRHTRTTSYHPQSNGLVENLNKQIKSIITCLLEKEHANWDVLLPGCITALRTSTHTATGFSPHYLVFGREARMPSDNVFQQPKAFADLPAYVQEHLTHLQEGQELAKQRLKLIQRKREQHYSNKPKQPDLPIGSLVFINNPVITQTEANKFHRKRRAVYEVIEQLSEVVYRIRLLNKSTKARKEELVMHRDNLLPVPTADYVSEEEKPESSCARRPKLRENVPLNPMYEAADSESEHEDEVQFVPVQIQNNVPVPVQVMPVQDIPVQDMPVQNNEQPVVENRPVRNRREPSRLAIDPGQKSYVQRVKELFNPYLLFQLE
ncbi:hypothetical protein BOX15_Mlig004203g3 [Macrostomum lignano]|uniref:Reverse transcriptase n=1 Tax=Macrostomum lignano TaxID=282301 RepID=A0A267H3L0_9PLAT|nr:hypothetical protein BOX15_Mlig004203g3 [Macrostomum lignano]